jgi:hypothetical protein
LSIADSTARAPLPPDRRAAAGRIVRRRAFWDALVLIAIFVAGSWAGSRYVAAFQQVDHGEFGQAEFGAAVTFACGRGYGNPLTAGPALADFLSRRADSFSCAQLPADLRLGPLNITQALYRYLMIAAALQWKWSGISWSGLTPLFGLAYALTLCAAYGLFRLIGGPLLGGLGVLPLAISTHHLEYLPHLRDYAKTPLMLLLLLVMAWMAMPPLDRRRCLMLAALFGAILGVGLGFRNDLMIHVLPFAAVVLLLLPGRWRANLGLKVACILLASATFLATAWPILVAYRSGSNTGHAAVLGLVTAFDRRLDVTRPAYDLGSSYLDRRAMILINTHSYLRSGRFVDYLSSGYDRAAVGLLGLVARHWPADILVRAYASVLQVLEFPFIVPSGADPWPRGVSAPWLIRFYQSRADALHQLSGLGPVVVTVSLIAMAVSDPRAAALLLLLLLYYCGYPAVQFDPRHFFHLEFVDWWALVFASVVAIRSAWGIAARGGVRVFKLGRAARRGSLMLVAIVMLALPLGILRLYQQRHLTSVIGSYEQATARPLRVSRRPTTGATLIVTDDLWSEQDVREPMALRYLRAEFGGPSCGAADLPLLVKYEAANGADDLSELVRIPIMAVGQTVRFFPVYHLRATTRFAGLVVPTGYEDCFRSVGVIDNLASLPVLVNLTLTPTWRSSSLYQRLASREHAWTSDAPVVRAVPVDLVVPHASRLSHVTRIDADRTAPGVTRGDAARGWAGRISDAGPYQLLIHVPVARVASGTLLEASGVMGSGGLAIGLVQNDLWVVSQTVTAPGPFTVLIRPPGEGEYGALVVNFSMLVWRQQPRALFRRAARWLAPPLLSTDFELHELAWVTPIE